ncbi:DUF6603 domain-containing protein [Gordonia sp. (in: high G+C Gram-positive bacteria)]|uniref:DUF6603 domain-containing protein n=1 Tax=Gordonia sp. (in: high G+C Gram-positive bacteria) TaxID=84139 RepID=UPI0026348760|nr:DUF6603 domain-containing protein [Gordonia sp. (in: high G+C Gram-positive bacteria)]
MSGSHAHAELELGGSVAGTSSSLEVALVVGAEVNEIPGITFAVDRMGAKAVLLLVLDDGGPRLDARAEPIYPSGALASIALPPVTGGGYFSHDGDTWSGALSADLGPLSVDGFGILTLPRDGDPSVLVMLTGTFTPPIQLSFGFTLVGVGGIVGINRRADRNALEQALHAGVLGDLMFPRHAVADAPRLLPALGTCFPSSPGSTVVGPMLKLGWGTPTLVSASVAVLISDANVYLLGKVAITLPHEDLALIDLRATILGSITGAGLSIQASLAGSSIVGLAVTGDLSLRIRGGDDPLFELSAGGFHPQYREPGRPELARIGAELSPGPFLRVRLGAYLAVTSNSVQFGAAADLHAGIGGFGISGGFSFDALMTLSPFAFTADLEAHVSIDCADFSVGSVTLSGHFSGPAPWRIRGRASVHVLFWKVTVTIPEITWGSSTADALPPGRDPLAALRDQVGVSANWTDLSTSQPELVQRRPRPAEAALLHPMTTLNFRQNAVPLGTPITRMDGLPLPEETVLNAQTAGDTTVSHGKFAPGQFLALDDDKQLTSAGYATYPDGFVLNHQEARTGTMVARDVSTVETEVHGLPSGLLAFDMVAVGVALPTRLAESAGTYLTVRDPAQSTIAIKHDLAAAEHLATAVTTRDTASLGAALTTMPFTAAAQLQVVPIWETL